MLCARKAAALGIGVGWVGVQHLPIARVTARCAAPSAVVVARGAQQRSSMMEQRMQMLLLMRLLLRMMRPGVMHTLCVAARNKMLAMG